MKDAEINEGDKRDVEAESTLANNPYSPYLNYETKLKENNEKYGEPFARLNESIYEEYDKIAHEALKSSNEYGEYRQFLEIYSTNRENNTRHHHLYEGDGRMREVVTPLRIELDLDGKVMQSHIWTSRLRQKP